jgi:hypothetical protein
MPMARKMTVFYSQTTGFGWSEQYKLAETTDENTAIVVAKQFVAQRIKLLTNTSQVNWVRIRSDKRRDPWIIAPSSFLSVVGIIPEPPNRDSDALLLRMETPNVGYNRVFLKGIPDAAIQNDKWVKTPETVAGVNALTNLILTNTAFVVSANVDNPQPPVLIQQLKVVPNGGFTFVTADPGDTFANGSRIRISGATTFGYNGVKTIVDQQGDAPVVYKVGGANPRVDNPAGEMVFAKLLQPMDGRTQFAFIEGATQHKSGRPFGLTRGRRSSVLPLRQ